MKITQLAVWVLVGLSLGLVSIDEQLKMEFAYLLLKSVIEFFLLSLGAFQILKSTQIRSNEFEHIITFRKLSSRFYQLIWMGIVLTLADFVLINHYAQILSSDTILVAILFLYYFGQILFHNKPRVLMGTKELVYDDYFPKEWSWQAIQHMEVDDEKMIITDQNEDFPISLQGADEVDPLQTGVELDAQVLDGTIHFIDDASNFRELLKESSEKHGFPLNQEEEDN